MENKEVNKEVNATNKPEKVIPKMKLYSLFDKRTEKFMAPQVKINNGHALRDLETIVKDKNSLVHLFPNDFEMWYLGFMEEDTGILHNENAMKIGEAKDYVEAENK